ncbi:MAG: flagellar hook-basal body complex protein, partial [Oscillospiraceae bacterium]|nr:flagellar hook-basal body complex protein [Oscillospiraceae bacterium]
MSNIGYYTAASGVISYQYAMDVTANNLANVNTFGFKASRPSFADLIYTERNNDNTETQFGHGVRVQKTDMMFEQSQLRETGSLSTLRLWTRASLRYSLPK